MESIPSRLVPGSVLRCAAASAQADTGARLMRTRPDGVFEVVAQLPLYAAETEEDPGS